MSDQSGWFAELDKEAPIKFCRWRPVLNFGNGSSMSAQVWFDSEQSCVNFIEKNIVGQPLYPHLEGHQSG